MPTSLNCSLLAKRTDFDTYALNLIDATHGDLELLSLCKVEVCGALWGQGNGDISGIGMIVGYVLEQVLGLCLVAVMLLTASSKPSRLRSICKHSLESFHDCGTFFAFSIEIAVIVVLVREDFGINAYGMGDDTVRITQAVAMLVLLPLSYALLILQEPTPIAPKPRVKRVKTDLAQSPRVETSASESNPPSRHFTLFVLCWAIAFYPFYSKMIAAFGPSKITDRKGPDGHPVITPQQFGVVQHICFGKIEAITAAEDSFMTALVMLIYIPLSLIVVARIIWLGVERNHPGSAVHTRLQTLSMKVPGIARTWLTAIALSATPLLGIGLLWSILRVESFQRALTTSTGGTDSDTYWTFGQVVAVTIFTPVLVDGYSAFKSMEVA